MINKKGTTYKAIVKTMLQQFNKLGCNKSMKLHFLQLHTDLFPENLDVKGTMGMLSHKDTKDMEKRPGSSECQYDSQWLYTQN